MFTAYGLEQEIRERQAATELRTAMVRKLRTPAATPASSAAQAMVRGLGRIRRGRLSVAR